MIKKIVIALLLLILIGVGTGIYMSDSLNTSLSYSTRGKHNNLVVVGVFQLTEDNKQFKKAPSIFVIPKSLVASGEGVVTGFAPHVLHPWM